MQHDLKRLKLAGIQPEDRRVRRFVVLVDSAQLKAMPKQCKSLQQQAQWIMQHIQAPEHLEQLQLNSWRSQVSNPILAGARGSVPFIATLLVGVLQYNALLKLSDDEAKAMHHEAKEALWRHRAAVMALGGTLGELAGKSLEKITPYMHPIGQGLNKLVSGFFTRAGRGAGFTGALIMAAFDFKQGLQSFTENHFGMGILYVGSSFFGFSAAVAAAFTLTGLGMTLVVLAIVTTFAIEIFKDNKVEEWLKRCYWGKVSPKYYKDVHEELAQLKLALS